jgi:hypothetical protein
VMNSPVSAVSMKYIHSLVVVVITTESVLTFRGLTIWW